MILRRVIAHFRKQEWTAIAIDFVIVVIGVFIGIQVSNWNAARAEQRRADELYDRLVADIRSERRNVAATVAYYEATVAYARTALREYEAPGSVDPEAFVVGAYQASQYLAPVTNRSTFEDMVATGALGLVRSETVRAKLIGYYGFDWTDNALVSLRPAWREAVRGVMPYPLQEAILAACGDREQRDGRTVIITLPESCDIDMPAAETVRASADLLAAPGFEQALRYQLSENAARVGAFVSVQNQLDDLIAAIEEGAP
jgi:hypothetical protein